MYLYRDKFLAVVLNAVAGLLCYCYKIGFSTPVCTLKNYLITSC